MAEFNRRMTAAVANLAYDALKVGADILGSASGLKQLFTVAGMNPDPASQTREARAIAGVDYVLAMTGSLGMPERAAARLTTSQATDLATYLGFKKAVRDVPINSMGQRVFTNGSLFMTQDITMHQGVQATWKLFDRNFGRLGTYNYDLSARLGR